MTSFSTQIQKSFFKNSNEIVFNKLFTNVNDVIIDENGFLNVWPYSQKELESIKIKPSSTAIIRTGLHLKQSNYILLVIIDKEYENEIRLKKDIILTNNAMGEVTFELTNVSETKTVNIYLNKPFIKLISVKFKKVDKIHNKPIYCCENPITIE